MEDTTNRRQRLCAGTPICFVFLVLAVSSCKTTDSNLNSDAASNRQTWQDVTIDNSGNQVSCEVEKPLHTDLNRVCLFHDSERGLIWSPVFMRSGKPMLLTWRQAQTQCKSVNMRLPSRSEYDAAVRNESGALRANGLIEYGSQSESFGLVLPFQSLWTDTLVTDGKKSYWAAQRIDNHFIFTQKPASTRLPFRCVQQPENPFDSMSGSMDQQASQNQMAKSTKPSKESDRYRIEILEKEPSPATPSEWRSRVTNYLRDNFSSMGFDGHLLDANGDVVIASASGFIFVDEADRLFKQQVPELENILSAYLKVLSAIRTLEGKNIRLQVIGHVSPSFRGAPQLEKDLKDPGALFNRKVALDRAIHVAAILAKIKTSENWSIDTFTRGADEGILDPNGPNSRCGQFSCNASRRVVIRFVADATN